MNNCFSFIGKNSYRSILCGSSFFAVSLNLIYHFCCFPFPFSLLPYFLALEFCPNSYVKDSKHSFRISEFRSNVLNNIKLQNKLSGKSCLVSARTPFSFEQWIASFIPQILSSTFYTILMMCFCSYTNMPFVWIGR